MTNQALSLAFALALMWVVANIPPQTLARAAVPLYVVAVALLVGVALFGVVVNGSRRWLNLGLARFQPSELMKIALPLMLAWYFQKFEGRIGWKDFAFAAAADRRAGVSDQAPARPRHRAADRRVGFLRAVPRRAVLEGDRRPAAARRRRGARWSGRTCTTTSGARILTFLDPSRDPLGAGYHSMQASIALGSGGHRRQGLAERHADAPRLPARAPHRFHLRGVRRGIRPDRQRRAARCSTCC